MGFWIFMLLMALLIPIMMVGFGLMFSKHIPRDINRTFGYRTRRSMKNKETWAFAHVYMGSVWTKLGAVMIPFSAVPMLFVMNKGEALVGTAGTIVCLIQLVPLLGSIFVVEKALKKAFDEDGNWKL